MILKHEDDVRRWESQVGSGTTFLGVLMYCASQCKQLKTKNSNSSMQKAAKKTAQETRPVHSLLLLGPVWKLFDAQLPLLYMGLVSLYTSNNLNFFFFLQEKNYIIAGIVIY